MKVTASKCLQHASLGVPHDRFHHMSPADKHSLEVPRKASTLVADLVVRQQFAGQRELHVTDAAVSHTGLIGAATLIRKQPCTGLDNAL